MNTMNFNDIISDSMTNPDPRAYEVIPWNDPGFSRRMLKEHLNQDHDLASRRSSVIDAHVRWIHETILRGAPGRILELGCGPGLYTSRLASLGHACTGIDFSPASIEYAREEAGKQGLDCTYTLGDLRTAEHGDGYDLVMFIFGDINTLPRKDARLVFEKIHASLKSGGAILLEPILETVIENIGVAQPSWYACGEGGGLFSDEPHIVLQKHFWFGDERNTTIVFYVVGADGAVARHANTFRAYSESEYRELLDSCGFGDVRFHGPLAGQTGPHCGDYTAITASKA